MMTHFGKGAVPVVQETDMVTGRKLGGLAILAIAPLVLTVSVGEQAPCDAPGIGLLLERAASRLRAFDDEGAVQALAIPLSCPDVELARMAVTGWVEARQLASKGGDTALLQPVNTWLEALARLRRTLTPQSGPPDAMRTRHLQIDYADGAIRAAVDAAQDEREEMSVYLEHTRDLAAVLASAGDPPMWPLPYDELEGELWLEVDRYAEARTAFARAVAREATGRSLLGLARAADRLDDRRAACDAYRRALRMDLAAAVKTAAAEFVKQCP